MIVAIGGQDRNYLAEVLDEPEQALARLDAALAIPGLERTSFCPGPDQFFSNSRAMLVPLKRWAREHGTLFHIHSAEEPKTTRWFSAEVEPGQTEVEFAESLGILDGDTVLAHQVNCGPRDVGILARTGAKVVHNPLANTILGLGHAAGDGDAGGRRAGGHLDRRLGLGRQPEHPRRGAPRLAVPEGAAARTPPCSRRSSCSR